ncbi:MAG: hypothetical protein QM811_05280 [Pirellulales bacterium]
MSLSTKLRDGRSAAVPLRVESFTTLEYALTARTGFPDAVDFSKGRAEFAPWRTSLIAAASRDEIDALFVVGKDLPLEFEDFTIVQLYDRDALIGLRELNDFCQPSRVPRVELATLPTHEQRGTELRQDGIPIVRRPDTANTVPDVEVLLESLLAKIRALQEVVR